MSGIDFAKFNEEYYIQSNSLRDSASFFEFSRVVSQAFSGRILDVGCGLGWLVKHLRAQGRDAWGLDLSPYAIEHSADPEHCLLGDARKVHETFPTAFDVVVMRFVGQALELHELIEVIGCLRRQCKGIVLFLDAVPKDRSHFALDRNLQWYQVLFEEYGWSSCKVQPFLRKISPWGGLLVFEQRRMPFVESSYKLDFVDPWLIHHDNTSISTCTLPTSEVESAAFQDAHRGMWMDVHFAPGEGFRLEKERKGVTTCGGDYVLVSDDTARISRDWLCAALAQFRDPSVGVVVSPVQWLGGQGVEEAPGGDYWDRFPMMFRVLAYQQSRGGKSKFDELGWKVAKIKTPMAAGRSEELREFDEVPSVTIVTPFDDSKVKLLGKYLEALDKVEYPRDRLHIHFWSDSRERAGINEVLAEFVASYVNSFASLCVFKANTEGYWLYMEDEGYYKWPGVRYPMSARVAGLYNRAARNVTTDQALLWESDTIPVEPNFLRVLSDNLSESDGGISAHYVCRKEKKSLAWGVESIVPFDYKWLDPGSGVQVVGAVPHGLLLLNSFVFGKFRFSVLANDPRDFRGPDLVMGRDFERLGLRLKIHWDVHAHHYESDGEHFLRPPS